MDVEWYEELDTLRLLITALHYEDYLEGNVKREKMYWASPMPAQAITECYLYGG